MKFFTPFLYNSNVIFAWTKYKKWIVCQEKMIISVKSFNRFVHTIKICENFTINVFILVLYGISVVSKWSPTYLSNVKYKIRESNKLPYVCTYLFPRIRRESYLWSGALISLSGRRTEFRVYFYGSTDSQLQLQLQLLTCGLWQQLSGAEPPFWMAIVGVLLSSIAYAINQYMLGSVTAERPLNPSWVWILPPPWRNPPSSQWANRGPLSPVQ